MRVLNRIIETMQEIQDYKGDMPQWVRQYAWETEQDAKMLLRRVKREKAKAKPAKAKP